MSDITAGAPKAPKFTKKTKELGVERFNRVSQPVNIGLSLLFIVLALVCTVPFLFVIIISFSSNTSIQTIGYTFTPSEWSLDAYVHLWREKATIGTSFLISIFITVVGTVIGLFLNSTMGYVLSRRTFKWRRLFTTIIFIPMLFGGGLVASYLVNTQLLHLRNSVWALILPLSVSSFNIIILRTFFQTTVPDSIIESAKIDGAAQLRIFFTMVLPISLPALATVGLFLSFAFWNDWYMAMLYIQSTHTHLWPLQYVLYQIQKNLEFLSQNAQYMGAAGLGVNKLPAESARMAICVVIVLPIACSYPFFQRYFVSGLTIGSVKG